MYLSRWRRGLLTAAATVLTIGLAACGDGGGAEELAGPAGESGAAKGAPWVFGLEVNLAGANAQPHLRDVVEAYFADWNARGGYRGRPVKLITENSGQDPTTTAAAAQKLINSDKVLALVGNSAVLDCSVNAQLIESSGTPVISNPNDNACHTLPHVFPVHPNSIGLLTPSLSWAVDQGGRKFAMVYPDLPTAAGPLQEALRSYLAENGDGAQLSLFYQYPLQPTAADADGFVAKAKAAGADTVVVALASAQLEQVLVAADRIGYGPRDGMRFIGAGSTYDPGVPATLGAAGTNFYALSFSKPWQQTDDPDVATALDVVEGVDRLDGYAAFAYESAWLLEQALNKIDGEVTRESLQQALTGMTSIRLPLAADPYDYSVVPSKDKPRTYPLGGRMVQVKDGAWTVASEWIEGSG